jgi:alpha-galactosidase
MSSSISPRGAIVALTASGVTVLVDVTEGCLPAVVHWGAELPALDEPAARALAEASVPVLASNAVAAPPRPALLPEHSSGWTGQPGLRGSFGGSVWSPRFLTRTVQLGGEPVRGFAHPPGGVLDVTAVDDSDRLRLDLTLELLDGGLLRTRASLTNLATDTYALEGLFLALPIPGEARELLDFAGAHNYERVPQRRPLHTGAHVRDNHKGRTGADSAYVLHAGTPGFGFADGEIWAVHTAWSGNHRHYAERVFTGEQLLGGGELLLPGEVRLAPGGSYQSPWLYAAYGVGLDATARRFHTHVRSRAPKVSTERPVTLNVWEAVYFNHDLDHLTRLAERAAAVGVERYVLDDGWFGSRRDDTSGLGDWVVSKDVWPAGLHPLVDRVRALGMQFGLWFEPEMVSPDSDLARAHPDWIMSARAELPVPSRKQQVLNLTVPGAYEHVRGQILALLAEYKIDYIKWDHNRDLIEAGSQLDEGRPAVHAQTLAFYRLLDDIRAAFPTVEIESCSSGGARVDLGVLERTDRVWPSDNIDPHDRQSVMRWTAQLLPPEYLGSHIASARSHVTGRHHDLAFRAATAVFGHLGVEWDLTRATDEELDALRRWIAYYQSERHLLLSGTVVRVDTPDPDVLVHGVVSEDRSRAIFALVVLDTTCPDPPARFKVRGLDPERTYRIRPVFTGPTPSGLVPPQWWGQASREGSAFPSGTLRGQPSDHVSFPGTAVSGQALHQVGLAAPRLHPDQAVIFHIDATDAPSVKPNHAEKTW